MLHFSKLNLMTSKTLASIDWHKHPFPLCCINLVPRAFSLAKGPGNEVAVPFDYGNNLEFWLNGTRPWLSVQRSSPYFTCHCIFLGHSQAQWRHSDNTRSFCVPMWRLAASGCVFFFVVDVLKWNKLNNRPRNAEESVLASLFLNVK